MRDLLYRLPRFTADFPVDVIVGELAFLGICKNISETGIRGEFRHRLPVGTEGLLRLNHPRDSMELRASVAYANQQEMAFHFLFRSESERKRACEFAQMANLTGAPLRAAAPPVRGLRYMPATPPDKRFR